MISQVLTYFLMNVKRTMNHSWLMMPSTTFWKQQLTVLVALLVMYNYSMQFSTRLSAVRSWPSRTWVRTGPTPWVRVSGPVRSGPAPNFVGPGPGGEWTGPWGRTGVGPGPNLYFQFLILCTVSNYHSIIL